MKRKIISAFMALSMMVTMSSSFALAETDDPGELAISPAPSVSAGLSDIAGADCENAANALISAGILTGFPDGTFRPDESITRAQACAVIYKGFPHDDADYTSAAEAFSDLSGSQWAVQYIGYCAEKGIVKGYGDGTFHPSAEVTYYEYITMLVRAMGLADDATMAWPGDYIAVAEGTGLLSGMSGSAETYGNLPAKRGDCAVMLCEAADIETGDVTPENPGTSDGTGDDSSKPSDQPSDNNILSNFSGNAYGLIIGSGQGLNKDGEAADFIEFLMGGRVYTLYEDSSSSTATDNVDSYTGLVKVQLSWGEIRSITPAYDLDTTVMTQSGKAHAYVFSTGGPADGFSGLEFYKILDCGSTFVTYQNEAQTDAYKGTYAGINNPCIVYTAAPAKNGSDVEYELGSNSDIREGCYFASFTIDKESGGIADVVIVIDEDDADELLLMGETPGYMGILAYSNPA